MGGATLVIFLAVIHRYGAGMPIPYVQDWLLALNFSWAQELCIYMFVWMAKFGAAYGVRTGIHVGVDVVINHLPEHAAPEVHLLRFVCRRAVHRRRRRVRRQVRLAPARTPTRPLRTWSCRCGWSTSPSRCGSGLMCFRFLQVAWSFRRTGELPHHDAAHVEGVEHVADEYILPARAVDGGGQSPRRQAPDRRRD